MNVIPAPAFTGLFNIDPVTLTGPFGQPNKVNDDKNNFSPMIGIAYAPRFDYRSPSVVVWGSQDIFSRWIRSRLRQLLQQHHFKRFSERTQQSARSQTPRLSARRSARAGRTGFCNFPGPSAPTPLLSQSGIAQRSGQPVLPAMVIHGSARTLAEIGSWIWAMSERRGRNSSRRSS